MKILCPTLMLHESSIRIRIGMSGLLLMAALGGSVVAVLVMRRRAGTIRQLQTGPAMARERTIESRLKEIESLHEQSLISDAEHDEMRKRVLGGI
jgi:hypothetical protein